MTWTDPNPLDVKYVGYSTGAGSHGEFKFCNLCEYDFTCFIQTFVGFEVVIVYEKATSAMWQFLNINSSPLLVTSKVYANNYFE